MLCPGNASKEGCLRDISTTNQDDQAAAAIEGQEGWLTVHTKRSNRKAPGTSRSSSSSMQPTSPHTPGLPMHATVQHWHAPLQHDLPVSGSSQHASPSARHSLPLMSGRAAQTAIKRSAMLFNTAAPSQPSNTPFSTPVKAWAVPTSNKHTAAMACKDSSDSIASGHDMPTSRSWPKLGSKTPGLDVEQCSGELLPCTIASDDGSEISTMPCSRLLSCCSTSAGIDDCSSATIPTTSNSCVATCCVTSTASCAGDDGQNDNPAEVDVLFAALSEKLLLHEPSASRAPQEPSATRATPPEGTAETTANITQQTSCKQHEESSDEDWPSSPDALAAAAVAAATAAAAAAATAARIIQPKQRPPPAPRPQLHTPRHPHPHHSTPRHPTAPQTPPAPPPPPHAWHEQRVMPVAGIAGTGAMQGGSQSCNSLPDGQAWGYPAPMYVRIGPDGPEVVSALDMPQSAAHHHMSQQNITSVAAQVSPPAAGHPHSSKHAQHPFVSKSVAHVCNHWPPQAQAQPAAMWQPNVMYLPSPAPTMQHAAPYAYTMPPMGCIMYQVQR